MRSFNGEKMKKALLFLLVGGLSFAGQPPDEQPVTCPNPCPNLVPTCPTPVCPQPVCPPPVVEVNSVPCSSVPCTIEVVVEEEMVVDLGTGDDISLLQPWDFGVGLGPESQSLSLGYVPKKYHGKIWWQLYVQYRDFDTIRGRCLDTPFKGGGDDDDDDWPTDNRECDVTSIAPISEPKSWTGEVIFHKRFGK